MGRIVGLALLVTSWLIAPANADERTDVDAVFDALDSTVSPGCVVSVMHGGRIVYKRGYGMADLDHNVPNKPSTVFHVASMSKQFTAAAVVLLAREGKISLDDPAQKYVSEVPDFGAPITIRQLIHHTSGLRDQWELLGFAGWRYSLDLITDDDVLAVVSRQKALNFPPNTKYVYSNTGYTLLAQIVKRVSGQSFREFTTKRIFEPLGMHATHFRDDHAEIVPNMAYGYARAADTFKLSVTNFDTVGATSLLTTVEDLALWDENFYEPRVGGGALLEQMHERGVLNDGTEVSYAFGLDIGSYRGLPTVDHAGGDAGYRSDMLRFPEQHFTVACLCNLDVANPSNFTRKVADIYLAKDLAPLSAGSAGSAGKGAVELTPADTATLLGTYRKRGTDEVLRVAVIDGNLRVGPSDAQTVALIAETKSRFYAEGIPIFIEFSAGMMKLDVEGQPRATYERLPDYAPSADELAAFAGTYVSDELEIRYNVALIDGALTIGSMKLKRVPLTPVAADLFSSPFATLRFVRDPQSHVSGFFANTLRTTNLAFSKLP